MDITWVTVAVIAGAFFLAGIIDAVSGAVVWQVVLPAALLNILGNYIGAGLALHKGAKVIRPMFFVVLLMLLVRLAVTLFF